MALYPIHLYRSMRRHSFLSSIQILFQGRSVQHRRWLAKCLLQLQVCLLLDSLRILKSLDKLHFQFFHLSNFVHFYITQYLFSFAFFLVLLASIHDFSALFLGDFHLGKALGLEANLILHLIFLPYSLVIHEFLLLVLVLNHLGLLSLLLLLKKQCILNLLLFFVPLFGEHIVVLTHLLFHFIIKVNIVDFL